MCGNHSTARHRPRVGPADVVGRPGHAVRAHGGVVRLNPRCRPSTCSRRSPTSSRRSRRTRSPRTSASTATSSTGTAACPTPTPTARGEPDDPAAQRAGRRQRLPRGQPGHRPRRRPPAPLRHRALRQRHAPGRPRAEEGRLRPRRRRRRARPARDLRSRELPMAFRFCVVTVASDGILAKYGTPFTPLNHYAPWNVDDDGKPRSRSTTPSTVSTAPASRCCSTGCSTPSGSCRSFATTRLRQHDGGPGEADREAAPVLRRDQGRRRAPSPRSRATARPASSGTPRARASRWRWSSTPRG
jgi:hypothetical protein